MGCRSPLRVGAPLLLAWLATFLAGGPVAADVTAAALSTPRQLLTGCLPAGNGFLRARIRGALNLDLGWNNGEMECAGELRPDGSGIRLSFAGPARGDGRRLRLVFGIASVQEGRDGRALPTNLTVIFEGEQRLYATRGDDRCTVDALTQERVGALGGPTRTYRVIARGFCVAPASTVDGRARILVDRFDFAGAISFTEGAAPAATSPPAAHCMKAPCR